MQFKYIFLLLLAVSSFIVPSTLSATDFEWRLNLNLRAQNDPYGYRYGLINRFGLVESDMMLVLNRVYEPSDEYMIFRLSELSGHAPEYVLHVYHERRANGWYDIAMFLGIRADLYDFVVLREHHDMRDVYYDYNYRRKEHYEERYNFPVQKHYVLPPKRYISPPKKYYVPQPQAHEKPRHEPTVVVKNRSQVYNHNERQEPKKKSLAPTPKIYLKMATILEKTEY